jgi:Domain of unknown function (DUF6265)
MRGISKNIIQTMLITLASVAVIFLFVWKTEIFDYKTPEFKKMEWLIGTWRNNSEEQDSYEIWEKTSAATIEGINYTFNKILKDTVFSESLRIFAMEGEVFYLAKISQNDLPVSFKLIRIDDHTIIFENLEHDFPNYIKYSRDDHDKLLTEVYSKDTLNPKKIQAQYEKLLWGN